VKQSEAKRMDLGSTEECNERIIHQSIRPGIVDTCQIVMGFTQLAPGSIWNTMPPHTHRRRTEVYMYFDLDESSNVFHFMGEPDETRSLVVRNGEAVVSPSWSLHCAAGTRNYTFIWGMGGENQEFDDTYSGSRAGSCRPGSRPVEYRRAHRANGNRRRRCRTAGHARLA
jgi:4-deoxy-L-threo-5-hexosulose-uronate ketol-isomerase